MENEDRKIRMVEPTGDTEHQLQSSVDRMMPYRLLMYMVQIWKQELANVRYVEAQDKDYKLPAIVPIVLVIYLTRKDIFISYFKLGVKFLGLNLEIKAKEKNDSPSTSNRSNLK